MSDKIELMRLCGVLQSNFSCLSQSESRTQPCYVRINVLALSGATMGQLAVVAGIFVAIVTSYQ